MSARTRFLVIVWLVVFAAAFVVAGSGMSWLAFSGGYLAGVVHVLAVVSGRRDDLSPEEGQ